MSENIELQTFRSSNKVESDIEEYEEINQSDFINTTYAVKPKDYDFFTQVDVKTEKHHVKKKKLTKVKQSNLLDIINSGLAAAAVPVEENVILKSSFTSENQLGYLDRTRSSRSHSRSPFRRSTYSDFEEGFERLENAALSPVFPKVLENHTNTDHLTIPVAYIGPSMFEDGLPDVDKQQTDSAKFLDIVIKDLKFKHHHQFSLEKLLCNKLIELYNEHNAIKTKIKDTVKDITINRDTRDNLKRELSKISPNKKDDMRFDRTVRKYTDALLQLKHVYAKLLKEEKEVTHKIISLWSDIQMIREKTEIIETNYVLDVSKRRLSEEEYENEWNKVFNEEFSDSLDKMEYDYVTKYLEYKEEKYTQNLDDSAKKRIKKPKLEIDEKTLKEDVEIITNNIVGKDEINMALRQDEAILSSQTEFQQKLHNNEYFFEIYVDDVFVCESEHVKSKSNKVTDIEFTESFSVQILPKNETLALLLTENGQEVADLTLNLTDLRNAKSSEFVSQKFVYNVIVEPNVRNVGSGYNIKEIASESKVRLKSSNLFDGILYTTCEINMKIGWSKNLKENKDEEVKSLMEVGRQLKRLMNGIEQPTTDQLIDIINKIYEKDISNDENIISSLRNICGNEISDNDHTFPIDDNSPEFTRLKLLHLRDSGDLADVENKVVPVHASQISTELLTCLQKSKESFDVQYFSTKYNDMDPIDLQRYISTKYVQKLNRNMLKNLNEHLLRKTSKDVVRDFKDLSVRSIFTNQSTLATLATISSGTKQQLLREALSKQQEIRITVHRAFNLCDRSSALLEDEESDELIAGFKVRPLRPFVRLGYHGITVQTATAIGCHPTWNQTIKIDTKLDPLSSIQVNIFDEYKVNVTDASDEEQRTVHYRYYNRWIGALQIPLLDVLNVGSLRNTFKITTPPLLFGYESPSHTKASSQSLIPEVNQVMKKDASFISLHITTSLSHLGGLHGYGQPIPNSDDDYLINHLNNFTTEYANDFPSRYISLTFIDSSGKNKCVTQFVQPIPCPDWEWFPKNPKTRIESALSKSSGKSSSSSGRKKEEAGEEKESIYSALSWRGGESQLSRLMDVCARYVALVPTRDVTQPHAVTLSGVELLKVLYGSPLEHALLLAGFFLQLSVRCWLAITSARRHAAYVITRYDLTTRSVVLLTDRIRSRGLLNKSDGYTWHVYDASRGDRTELRDVACPLRSVDYVFDSDNIWVNVQSSQDCESMSFDFRRSSDWRPVFDKSIFVMKLPPATEAGLYTPPPDIERLTRTLEARLRDKVQKWRATKKTIWNRYSSGLLKESLPHWEYWAFHPSDAKPSPSQRLRQLMVSYKIFGFPLNLPYANTKSVISSVKSTGVHACDDPNVEFGLAVDVCAYPNNVISVWVFFASVSRL